MNVSMHVMITLTERTSSSAVETAGMSNGHGYAEVFLHYQLQYLNLKKIKLNGFILKKYTRKNLFFVL